MKLTSLAAAAVIAIAMTTPAPADEVPVPLPKPIRPERPPTTMSPMMVICGDRELIVSRIEELHGESLRALGAQADDRLLELYASESGSWSILSTDLDGRSCMIAVGESWHDFDPMTEGPEA